MRKVLLLSTRTDDGKLLLWGLREAGYSTNAIGNASKNDILKISPLLDKFYDIPEIYSFEQRSYEIIKIISEIVQQENIEIIMPSGFDSVKFISQYQEELNKIVTTIAVPSIENIQNLGNKSTFSLFCKQHNIPHPRTFLLENTQDILKDDLPIAFPLLTKPFELSSGDGIYTFQDKDSLYQYITSKREDNFNNLPILLQEYMPGTDIDFNGFCDKGNLVAWSVQRIIRTEDDKPLCLQFELNEDIYNICKKLIEKSNYSGPIHVDLRIDSRDNSVKTIEINPRFWASITYSICAGVNFADVAIRSAFDKSYTCFPKAANQIWGIKLYLVPFLYLKSRDKKYLEYVLKISFFQYKYLFFKYLYIFLEFLKKTINL